MNYAITILEEQLNLLLPLKGKVKPKYKNQLESEIEDLQLAIHNLKMLE